MRNNISNALYLVLFAVMSAACVKADPENLATPFTGEISLEQEVDLGLSANWAGWNLGAESPEEYGKYLSWGELSPKDSCTEANYKFFDAATSSYTMAMGASLDDSCDAASCELGYGWHMPYPEDIQELIDNCTITYASYKGVNGWVVTSRVSGYEGRSVFFPASGYLAGGNHNYQGEQCVFWTNTLADGSNSHAQNGFFTSSALCLNAPPKGVGGTVWCGYPVRPVRKFFFAITGEDSAVTRTETSYSFNVTGNSKWTASVSGTGASISPVSGEGAGTLTVTFPVNDTEDNHEYVVSVKSAEKTDAAQFTITQFGVVPDFKFSASSSVLDWDASASDVELIASASVSWTADIVDADGNPVSGASVTPASGSGNATLNTVIPFNTSITGSRTLYLRLTTDNQKVPEEIRTIKYEMIQERCPYAPFGTTWGSTFFAELSAAFKADSKQASYTIQNVTIQPKTAGTLTVTSSYIGKQVTVSFIAAESGDALLTVKARVAGGTSTKRINVCVNDVIVDKNTMSNSTKSNVTDTYYVHLSGISAGDKISMIASDSGNHYIYTFSWNKE